MNVYLINITNWRRVLVQDTRVAVYEGSSGGWHVVLCTLHAEDADCTATAIHGASGQVAFLLPADTRALRKLVRAACRA